MTLLHQKHRRRDEQGRFISDISDYAIVYQLLEESFAESLGKLKRYTDDRIRLVEREGAITPRALSEKIGVSTAAISQCLKPLTDKGVLSWCDEKGAEFEDEKLLEKAKRSGMAYLSVVGGKTLPTPFLLTGDIRWDKGGELHEAYDLQFDNGDGVLAYHQDEVTVSGQDRIIDDDIFGLGRKPPQIGFALADIIGSIGNVRNRMLPNRPGVLYG